MHAYMLPMKSRMIQPSENLPAGFPKYVSPCGGPGYTKAATKPPISKFEAPKYQIQFTFSTQ